MNYRDAYLKSMCMLQVQINKEITNSITTTTTTTTSIIVQMALLN